MSQQRTILKIQDEHDSTQFIWYEVRPVGNGLLIHIFKDEPDVSTPNYLAMNTVLVDFFGNQLRLLYWEQARYGEDPSRVVLTARVSEWTSKFGEDGEDLPRESESEQ
jgi:hypothetical protein